MRYKIMKISFILIKTNLANLPKIVGWKPPPPRAPSRNRIRTTVNQRRRYIEFISLEIRVHNTPRPFAILGIHSRNLFWEFILGIHSRNLFCESILGIILGIHSRNLFWEFILGIHSRNLFWEFILGIILGFF